MEQWINFQQSLQQRSVRQELDQEQKRAKNFSLNGHALIRGVAGSGKSLILKQRAQQLIEQGFERVLVLTYNRFMQGWLNDELSRKAPDCLDCRTFHAWAWHEFRYEYDWDPEQTARQQIVDRAARSDLRYQAILIDEAQDFYDEWFLALQKVLDPETNSLLFVYDNTQSIYGSSRLRKSDWTWKNLGIEVAGRSQIFDLNYRNSPEILETAWKFILPALSRAEIKVCPREQAGGNISAIVEPKTKQTRSSGIAPMLIQINNPELPEMVAQQVQQALASHADSSIGILTHPDAKDMRQAISKQLKLLKISHFAPKFSRDRHNNIVTRPTVIVDSWNALKGIEFDAVILVGLDQVPEHPEDPYQDFQTKAGLYTAMTRARDHLVMTYQDKTAMIAAIETAITSPPQLKHEP